MYRRRNDVLTEDCIATLDDICRIPDYQFCRLLVQYHRETPANIEPDFMYNLGEKYVSLTTSVDFFDLDVCHHGRRSFESPTQATG